MLVFMSSCTQLVRFIEHARGNRKQLNIYKHQYLKTNLIILMSRTIVFALERSKFDSTEVTCRYYLCLTYFVFFFQSIIPNWSI